MERDVCQACIVCCVYSVQIIACFSAFSIECHKKDKKKSLQHSHTITQKKKQEVCFLCCLEWKSASYELLGANCSCVM